MTLIPDNPRHSIQRTSTSLMLDDDLPFAEWEGIGRLLLEAAESVMWWVGDWLNYGEAHYGSTYTAAAEWTGLDPGTLADAKWVAKAIETSDRSEVLSWSHHRAVAALQPSDRAALLNSAAEEGWTRERLQAEVRASRQPTLSDKPPRATVTFAMRVEVSADAEAAARRLVARVAVALDDQLRADGIDATVRVT